MTTEAVRDSVIPDGGSAELTVVGKRLEILRIERGFSKQRLARHAGTSRQQLWRVMTGKSELTTSLRERLASALAVESAVITTGVAGSSQVSVFAQASGVSTPSLSAGPISLGEYLTDPQHLILTLSTLPSGDSGRRVKRALLNAIEDLAVETGRALPIAYSEIHRSVLAGEL